MAHNLLVEQVPLFIFRLQLLFSKEEQSKGGNIIFQKRWEYHLNLQQPPNIHNMILISTRG